MKKILTVILIALSLVFTSCVTCKNYCVKCNTCTEQTADTVKDTIETKNIEYIVKIDSVMVKDSVIVKEKGDTIFVDRWHWKYITKVDTVVKADTVFKAHTEYVDKTQTVEVNKLKWWQKFLMWIGIVGLVAVGGALVWKFVIKK